MFIDPAQNQKKNIKKFHKELFVKKLPSVMNLPSLILIENLRIQLKNIGGLKKIALNMNVLNRVLYLELDKETVSSLTTGSSHDNLYGIVKV